MLAQVAFELLDLAGVDQHLVSVVHGPAYQGDLIVVCAQARAFDVEKHATLREAGGNAVVLALRQPAREERDVAVGEGFLGCLHGRLQRAAAFAVHVELDGDMSGEVLPIRDAFRPEPRFLRYADSRKMLEGAAEQVRIGHGWISPIGYPPRGRGAMPGGIPAGCDFSGVRQPGRPRPRPGIPGSLTTWTDRWCSAPIALDRVVDFRSQESAAFFDVSSRARRWVMVLWQPCP